MLRVVPYALADQCGLGCREGNRRMAHGADVELCPGVVEMKRDGTAGDTENAADLPGGLALGGPPEASPPGRSRSEEHTSELQSLMRISYAVFCLKKKTRTNDN